MSRLLAILWILLISAQASYQGLIYTYYIANKDYIKSQLCENRALPELKCDGKCHLKKVLNISKTKQSQEPQPFLPSLEEIKTPVLFYQTICSTILHLVYSKATLFDKGALFEYAFTYQYSPIFSAFQPPRA
ncbi:hypothetical protein [Aureispira anguillae]|uniref:Uncharacterized protein n=1 Tax=Aureispira anguillae TaxID=2864201 RepID=A0A915VJV5_9BACT|nr:hypothetical protein [Aureispira anguillae]BDS09373.1 hypothetical protein AsAng_0000710 [Aureispira anguillae]